MEYFPMKMFGKLMLIWVSLLTIMWFTGRSYEINKGISDILSTQITEARR